MVEIRQGITLIHSGNETLRLEKIDDVVHVDLELMRIIPFGDIAVTGIRSAANYLGLHENTVRRYIDKGILSSIKLPTGGRRIPIEAVKLLRDQMYSEVEEGSEDIINVQI